MLDDWQAGARRHREEVFFGRVLDVDDQGRLVVESGGDNLALDSADVLHLRDDRGDGSRPDWGP